MSSREPWCLVYGVFLGQVRVIRLKEALIPWAESFGWSVLIRDSDIPNADLTGWHVPQSNPRRQPDHGYGAVEGD